MKIKRVLFVFFLALIVRIVYAWFFIEHDNLFLEDQSLYIQLGKTMAKTGGLLKDTGNGYIAVTEQLPGYPKLLSMVYTLFGENIKKLESAKSMLHKTFKVSSETILKPKLILS